MLSDEPVARFAEHELLWDEQPPFAQIPIASVLVVEQAS